jgi:hypothetical protein
LSALRSTYCIDTSALIGGYNRIYPQPNFVGLWERMGDLVDAGRLVSSEEVYKELAYQEDALFDWAKAHRAMFHQANYREQAFMTQIANEFPGLSRSRTSANTADPFVVAHAGVHGYIVVSEEKREGSDVHPKIPMICRRFSVAHHPFLTIIKMEGWVFP